jgi:hypothetical protein
VTSFPLCSTRLYSDKISGRIARCIWPPFTCSNSRPLKCYIYMTFTYLFICCLFLIPIYCLLIFLLCDAIATFARKDSATYFVAVESRLTFTHALLEPQVSTEARPLVIARFTRAILVYKLFSSILRIFIFREVFTYHSIHDGI